MTDGPLDFTVIDGIKCFSPEVADAYTDYPDGGFEVTADNVETSFWVRSRNRLFRRLVSDYVKPAGTTRLLEIGCGTGDFLRHIVDMENLELTGSEVYRKGLVAARKGLPQVEFVQLDITRGRIGDRFDMITAFDVIEHVESDERALYNMQRMLHRGGVLLLTVPQHMFLWSTLDDIVKHKRRYSRAGLLRKLRSSGLEPERCTSFVFVLFPFMLLSRLADKRRGRARSDEEELEKRVRFPAVLNWTFDAFMRVDEALIRRGISLPYGGTLVVVARKRLEPGGASA